MNSLNEHPGLSFIIRMTRKSNIDANLGPRNHVST